MRTPHEWLGELAAQLHVPRRALLVLDPKNDPWNTGTEADLRDAKWAAEAWSDHIDQKGHIRRLHYRVDAEQRVRPDGSTYVNDGPSWAWLQRAHRRARDLELIDLDSLRDQRNRPITFNGSAAGDVPPVELYTPAPRVVSYETVPADLDDVTPVLSGFGLADDAPYRLAVVVEKSTVDDVLAPLCEELDVAYIAATGYVSHTRIRELALADDRPLRIFYVSDHDHAGLKMPRAFARRLEFLEWRGDLNGLDIALDPLVLTAEQVETYGLPRSPDKDATELDALESLHPGALADIVTEAVERWRDADHTAEVREAREQAWELVIDVYDAEVLETAAEAVRAELSAAHEAYEQALDRVKSGPAMTELERLAELASDALDAIELPERPSPFVEDSAYGWLYRSDRDYLEQLDYYREASA